MRLLRALLLLPLLAAPAAGAGDTEVSRIKGSEVRLRAGPGMKHPVLAMLGRGDLVIRTGQDERWVRVLVPGGFACFVHGKLVERRPDGTARVKATRVLLRATAGKDFAPLTTVLDRDETVTVLGEAGDWLRIIPPERTHLYVFEELIEAAGPVEEHRAALDRAAKARRERLLASRLPRKVEKDAAAVRKAHRETVVAAGKEVLAGKGDTGKLIEKLTPIALESDDDLTSGYANSLIALLTLREKAERLREQIERAKKEKAEEVESLSARLVRAEARYREALRVAQVKRELRERPFRGVGTIETRDGGFVLMEKGRLVYRLLSKRFDLSGYVGKRVGVNGRMVVTDPEAGITHLMVEKLEIVPAGTKPR
ncbi:MAG: SH3 domain-containing protein [Planctomycetota bacterium]|jgi:SH3-like domain-containing protein